MPKIPAEQISPWDLVAESSSAVSSTNRPKLRTRGEPGSARAPPLVALLSGVQTARYLDISTRTLTRWVKAGIFPPPIYLAPGSPAKWRVRDLDNWISKRAADAPLRGAAGRKIDR